MPGQIAVSGGGSGSVQPQGEGGLAFNRANMALGATIDRAQTAVGGGGQTQLTSGTLNCDGIYLPAGITISKITFHMGGTTFTTATNQWFVLFDSGRNKLQVTSDDTSTAWNGNSEKALTLASPYVTTYTGVYYLGIVWVGTGTPQPSGLIDSAVDVLTVAPRFCGPTTSTSLTNPASCPASFTFTSSPQGRLFAGVA